jgi:phospholipid/cholesterol/gamma-HCH transport system substrate-binding protein
MFSRALARLERANPVRIGAIAVVLVLMLGVGLFQKQKIATLISPGGEKVTAEFAGDYRLRPYVTKVKVAGVRVGVVTSVEPTDSGHALVTMKVDDGTREKLRSAPSASIRPATLLGGNYYLDLRPGGDPRPFEGTIPVDRTTVPVELDRVLDALQPDVRLSMRATISNTRQALGAKERRKLKQLLRRAPESLTTMTPVLRALRGTNAETDLTELVAGMESTARALTRNHGQLDRALRGLGRTGDILGRNGVAVRDAVGTLPSTLRTARTGLRALDRSLTQLRSTSETARPVVRELDGALAELEPALKASRPLMRDLVPTLRDLEPLVGDLLPTSRRAATVLDDVDGLPLTRLNGPIMDTLLTPWKGEAGTHYEGNGNDTPFYQELGYMFAGGSASGNMTDRNGSTLHFQPGAGPGTVSGLPISFEQLFRKLIYPEGPAR